MENLYDETAKPLIWTTKGNLPIDTLEYEHSWEDTPDQVTFKEIYRLDGEIVKQSAHVYIRKGLTVFSEQGSI